MASIAELNEIIDSMNWVGKPDQIRDLLEKLLKAMKENWNGLSRVGNNEFWAAYAALL